MMMMVAVMAEALHLFPNYGKHAARVKNGKTGVRFQGSGFSTDSH